MKTIKIGLLGLGTVGSGVVNVLQRNYQTISQRLGQDIVIDKIAVRDKTKTRQCDTNSITVLEDAKAIVNDPDIDIVVELIGGESLAKDLVLQAINNGKQVVTANKALIANHAAALFQAAQEHNVAIAFEAAVAGGIPIVKAIREGLSGNRIECVAGIINGTSNYILTAMTENHQDFATVLAEAGRLGYTEADPSLDIDGIDVAHKLTILAAIAFNIPFEFSKVYTEGISHITPLDINYADELGYRIKPLGIAQRTAEGIELRVHPTFIPKSCLLSHVDGVMNAVMVNSDAAGSTLYYGAGAGAEPTASAVLADIVDVAKRLITDADKQTYAAAFAEQVDAVLPMSEVVSEYYLRMQVADRAGILAEVTGILAELDISVESMLQKDRVPNTELVSIVIITHQVKEASMVTAIEGIEQLKGVEGNITRIRLEEF